MTSFEYPIRTYLPLVIFSFIVTGILFLSFIIGIIFVLIGRDVDITKLLVAGIEFVIFLQFALWFFRGRERVEATEDKFVFIRTNGVLTFRKTIKTREIEAVAINRKTFPGDTFMDTSRQQIKEMQGAVFFWRNMGRLEFKIGKKYKSFFNGLTDKDANETIKTLNQVIVSGQTDKRNST